MSFLGSVEPTFTDRNKAGNERRKIRGNKSVDGLLEGRNKRCVLDVRLQLQPVASCEQSSERDFGSQILYRNEIVPV